MDNGIAKTCSVGRTQWVWAWTVGEDSILDLEGRKGGKGFLEKKTAKDGVFWYIWKVFSLSCHFEGRNEKIYGDYYLCWEQILRG